jgi:PAS domain S-box-containing protein
MSEEGSSLAAEGPYEITVLVARLHETQQRLQALTGGEIDAVLHSDGQSYLLSNAQEKLRHSEQELRLFADTQTSILNALPGHVALLDRNGVIVSVNESWSSFAALNGGDPSRFGAGQNYLEVCEQATGPGAEYALASAAGIRAILSGASQKQFLLEYPCPSNDEERWFLLRVNPITKDGSGGAVVLHTDITERKLAEQKLTEQLQLMNMASSVAKLGAWAIEFPGPKIVWSTQVYRIHEVETSFKPDFETALNFFPPTSRQSLAQAIERGQPYDLELEFITAKGNKLWTRTTSSVERKNGTLNRFYGIFQDITERKKAEFRFRRLVDSNVQGVLFFDLKGRIIESNDAFLQIVGYTRQDLREGKLNWVTLTPPEFAELDRKALEQIAKNGSCKPYEKEYIRKDGSRVPILLGSAIFEDNPQEGVCFVVDQEERKKVEQQLLRSQRMVGIGTLAGGIAHDLNNVLAPIMMAVELLKASNRDPQSLQMLEILKNSAERGADLVKQVLSFARGIEGQKVNVKLVRLVRDLTKVIQETFPKSIKTNLTHAEGLWSVVGDPTQLHQVFLNLCVNARDAMRDGGDLNITIENAVVDETYASMNLGANPGCYVKVEVEDTGTGIPEAVRDRIFEPFFTTKEAGKGTGLGLSTTLAIVKGHGGFINVYSEVGKGTRFQVYLPAQTQLAASEPAEDDKPSLPRGNGELVLVVDDEEAIRKISQQTLESFGYQVLLARNGAEAISLYVQSKDKSPLS